MGFERRKMLRHAAPRAPAAAIARNVTLAAALAARVVRFLHLDALVAHATEGRDEDEDGKNDDGQAHGPTCNAGRGRERGERGRIRRGGVRAGVDVREGHAIP